jgi:cytoplasmic tRNA 2-thiolation protein 1
MFKRGEKVAVAVSGGKDSTVLAYMLDLLNKRHQYGVDLVLLSVDEGISGYREHSIETVRKNREEYGLDLKIVSYKDMFGMTMDDIVKRIGRRSNCTYCGVFRRQALERGAKELGVNQIATGHNANDIAETVIMNILRGDISRLKRCTLIKTPCHLTKKGEVDSLPRSKPFKYTYEREIVMYAFHKKLSYFSTECTYSPGAYRGHARILLRELEKLNPGIVLSIIESGEHFEDKKISGSLHLCVKCSHPTSSNTLICKGCDLMKELGKLG